MCRLPATAIADSAPLAANALGQAAGGRNSESNMTRMPTVTRRDIAMRLRKPNGSDITIRGRGASVADCVGM